MDAKLNISRLQLELAHPWKLARTERTSTAEVVLLELETSEGLIGRGEAAPVARYGESIDTVERFLRRIDLKALSPKDVPGSMGYLESLSSKETAAKCAVDLALLDLAGQSAGLPIFDWLKLSFPHHQPLTSFTIGIDDPASISSKVSAAKQFPIIKMKVGVPTDQANLQALRAVAPEKIVRVDANEGWKTKEEALQAIEWLAEDGRIEFVEQPMPASTAAADMRWLKQRSPLPILADESYHLARDIEAVAEGFHGVNVKLVKTGGILGARDALTAARKAGLKTMLGCMIETSVLISAAAHLATLCDYLDLDGNLLITNDPFRGVTAKNGVLSFADAPCRTGLCVQPR